jgi:hypothetical protein
MWEDLYRRLQIIETRGYRPVPKPTADALDRFEAQTGLPLPHSYRDFAVVFGPGELAEFARLCAPGYPGDDTIDLYEHNRFTHGGEDILTDLYGEPERVARLIFFGSTVGGEHLGWDPDEVQNPQANEYAVYGLARLLKRPVKLAPSFRAFVEGLLSGRVAEQLGYHFDDPPRQSFEPWVILK